MSLPRSRDALVGTPGNKGARWAEKMLLLAVGPPRDEEVTAPEPLVLDLLLAMLSSIIDRLKRLTLAARGAEDDGVAPNTVELLGDGALPLLPDSTVFEDPKRYNDPPPARRSVVGDPSGARSF